MIDSFEQYRKAVTYLESLSRLPQPDYFIKRSGRSFFLRRFEYFLNRIGNPHHGMRYIHVGGTSGKGSVSSMIQAGLSGAGYKTGLYLSPHPTTTIERFKINGHYIKPADFTAILNELKPSIDYAYQHSPYGRPSYFEILTAIAFVYFKQQQCDYVVLEVGLGGRHDATNVIDTPVATIINSIGLDHTEVLGNTTTAIAKEKSAIIKRDTVFFTPASNPKHIIKLFKHRCTLLKVPCNIVGAPNKQYKLKLSGRHQQLNAELSASVLKHLGVNDTIIHRAFAALSLPCRMEIIQKKPTVILDGAHNASKIKSVIDAMHYLTHGRIYLIIALTKKRNPAEVFKNIVPRADYVLVTRFHAAEQRCASPLDVVKKIQTKRAPKIFLDNEQALDYALKHAKPNDAIVITGSFYLAGELRQRWRSENEILKKRQS